jgi:membrane fusion protein (multidrug efflux system)
MIAVGCGGSAESGVETVPTTAVLAAADVVVVEQDDITTGPRISGTLEPAQKAVIRAEAGGSVLEVHVDIGQPVTKGQLLGRVDSAGSGDMWRSAKSGVSSAEQDLLVAQRDLDRVQRLAAAGAVSPRDLELAQSQVSAAAARLESSRANLASAGSQLGRTSQKSPIDGVVSERAVNPGDVVAPGAPMFTVIEPSSLRLEGSVPAAAAGSLAVGTTVKFEVQGFPGKSFEGKVEHISPAVDPVSRQIPILVSLPNPDRQLVAGLFAEGRIASEQRQGLVVPADAVDFTGAVPSVLRVADGKVEKVEVGVGIRDEASEMVELTSGVAPGDVLVLGSARDLEPGAPVKVESSVGAAAASGVEG